MALSIIIISCYFHSSMMLYWQGKGSSEVYKNHFENNYLNDHGPRPQVQLAMPINLRQIKLPNWFLVYVHSQDWYSHWGCRSHFKVAVGSFPSWHTIMGGHSFIIRLGILLAQLADIFRKKQLQQLQQQRLHATNSNRISL